MTVQEWRECIAYHNGLSYDRELSGTNRHGEV
jgi:hypothetical protein